MFCPKCGSEINEGAAFCPKCGNRLAERQREPQPSAQASAPAAQGDAATGRGVAQPKRKAAQPKRKAPVAVVLGVAAVIIVAVIGFNAFASSGASQPVSRPAAVASQSSSSNASTTTGVLTENAANRISPKEHLAISDLKIDVDSINRYVITGKISNSSNDTCNVEVAFGYVEHSSDKYGEEQTRERDLTDFTTVTPYCENGSNLRVYDLKGRETREFTLYPGSGWGSVEHKFSDIKAEVTKVWLPEANDVSRYDLDELIKIDATEYTADGKVEIDFTNNSGMYLDKVEVVVLGYNKDGLPIADGSNARPYGSVRYSGAANTLKPNDKGHISFEVGEGLSKVEVQHVIITPDKDKNTWQ